MVTRVNKPADGSTENDEATGLESLDAIAAMGASLDAPAPADDRAEAAVLASEADEIAGALALLRAAALPFAPEHVADPIAQVWNDRQLKEIARAIVEVCRMHGLTVSDFFNGYGPYISLAMAVGIPALATLKLLRIPPPRQTAQAADGQQQPA